MNETLEAAGIATIQGILNFLLGGDAMDMIAELVEIYDDKVMTNDEKRKAVKTEVMPIVRKLGKNLINVAIGLAVTMLRLQLTAMQNSTTTGAPIDDRNIA